MSIYDIEVQTIAGKNETLENYQGQVLLIVNTATKCGFAPQFKGLQKLHDEYGAKGFSVLGFPSGQFMNQELEENGQIAEACELNFGVSFPLYAKVDVNGNTAHPLFNYLSTEARGVLGSKAIKWNFTKFLVDRSGRVLKRFGPNDTPEKIESEIRTLVNAG
ncbi:glutathione peroxidase [Paenibacillus sp. NPDC058071]|uniref:glutathione peroxidase n=1 Tax=Paenibacillus sp. NPDC058071 TaxID=3346326 RepID=UPI0036D86565